MNERPIMIDDDLVALSVSLSVCHAAVQKQLSLLRFCPVRVETLSLGDLRQSAA